VNPLIGQYEPLRAQVGRRHPAIRTRARPRTRAIPTPRLPPLTRLRSCG